MTIRERLDLAEAELIRRMRNGEPLLEDDDIHDLYLTYDRWGNLMDVHIDGFVVLTEIGHCYVSVDFKSGIMTTRNFPDECEKFCDLGIVDYLMEYYEDHPVRPR